MILIYVQLEVWLLSVGAAAFPNKFINNNKKLWINILLLKLFQAEQIDHEYEEKRWSKRTQQLIHIFDRTLQFGGGASFKESISRNNRKQVASKFYTLLVLKKQQAIEVQQDEPYGDIIINKGPMYETVMG